MASYLSHSAQQLMRSNLPVNLYYSILLVHQSRTQYPRKDAGTRLLVYRYQLSASVHDNQMRTIKGNASRSGEQR